MPERLSALDASFLYMERPNVHMHVAGLAVLDPSTRPGGPLRFEDLMRLVAERIHLVPRFRQKVLIPPLGAGRPVWVDDEGFDHSFHMRRAALPAPGGRRELAEFVQRVQSRPLDRTKPLWEMYLIEGLEDGYVAALSKSHHAMIDGISGMDLASVMFDFTPETQRIHPPGPWRPEPTPSPASLWAGAVADQLAHPVRSVAEGAERLMRAPAEVAERMRSLAGGITSLLSLGQAPPGPFNVPIGPNRRFSMAEVPVSDAREIKKALGGTVNDVVLAATAGAVRRLLRRRGEEVAGLALRALMPVSIRDRSQRMAFGNQVSVFFVDLPVGERDPVKRLRKITRATRTLKRSQQAVAATALINSAGWAPATLHGLAARLVSQQRLINLVVSNVPGPQVPLYLDGARLLVAYPVMPLGPTTALSVAVTSLSGTMGFGFTGDWDAMPDIDDLARDLLDEVVALKKAAQA
ncbi:MAG TPA: wax ester/triacylglycerol synthase family O-acyltransferase [Actinomycetota bacterium]|nr:wax ester/triacylglycerol synthase family O-acyltransferase [Actinomycetota bacterium]